MQSVLSFVDIISANIENFEKKSTKALVQNDSFNDIVLKKSLSSVQKMKQKKFCNEHKNMKALPPHFSFTNAYPGLQLVH